MVLSLECPPVAVNYFSVSCSVTEVVGILMIIEVQTMLIMLCVYHCTTSQKVIVLPDGCDIYVNIC